MTETENPAIRESKLTDEILEAQKAGEGLLRWKLVLCAVLGAAGLGIMGSTPSSHIELLALIPFGCIYVDLLYANITLRAIIIGTYLRKEHDNRYEIFVCKLRNNQTFCLEQWAVYGSTYIISTLLILLALFHLIREKTSCWECLAIVVSAGISIILTHLTKRKYDKLVLSLSS